MIHWKSVRDGIDRFIAWTSRDKVLDAAAKVSLRAIPLVGSTLADLYEEAASGASGEDTTALLHEILARVEQIGAGGIDQVSELFGTARPEGIAPGDWLTRTSESLARLQGQIEAVRGEMRSMADTLDRMEEELTGLTWGATDFDSELAADEVRLLVLLDGLLSRSSEIFDEQDRIAQRIEQSIGDVLQPPREYGGRDDVLWWASLKGLVPDGRPRQEFRALRVVTDRMYGVNLRVRGLVRSNKSRLTSFDSNLLELHLSTWLAKYEYMRLRYDDHMCLVFVGAPPTDIGFPNRVDDSVRGQLQDAMSHAGLGHLTRP